MTVEELTDAELVTRSLAGDREAFSRIVSRYQVLICSLAYSRIGHLGQSEDVAQETFITAWRRLRLLREPAKLRAWLCGIVNNRIHKTLRREGREPVRLAEPIECVHEAPAAGALPSETAISREEQAILWRSLERIPDLYREPLVLFYRQHESVEAVARQLELTEDAVKQRLSRGRRLLQEEVQAFVENALRRTAPGQAFSGAVLAALPAGPAAGVGLGAAGKGAAAAKSGVLAWWLAALAPFVGILLGVISQWVVIRATIPAGSERRRQTLVLFVIWSVVIVVSVAGREDVSLLGYYLHWSAYAMFVAVALFWWIYAAMLLPMFILFSRSNWMSRQAREAVGEVSRFSPMQGAGLAIGMHLAMFSWIITLAWNAHDAMGAGMVAALMCGLAIGHFWQLRRLEGLKAGLAAGRHYGWCSLLIVAILNLRLDVWLAAHYDVSVAELHRLYPVWLIPALTLALGLWVGSVFVLLRRTAPLSRAPSIP